MPVSVGERIADTVARAATWRLGKGALPVPPEQRLPIILTLIGALIMPLGLSLVVMGWWGAAHTPFTFEQVPYLISGGLLGLALCLTGGFLFFGAWIARVALSTQRTADQIALLGQRMAGDSQPSDNGDAPARGAGGGATSERYVATATGSMLHRADCPIVATRDNLRDVSADEVGNLKPCQICQPAVAVSR
jgi:hypothetical protein